MRDGAARVRILTLLAVLFAATAGIWLYRSQSRLLHAAVERDLASVARLKVDQIAAYRADLLSDGAVLRANTYVAAGAERWLATGQPSERDALLACFAGLRSSGHYSDVLLVDATGRVRLGLAGADTLPAETRSLLAEASRRRTPVLSDLYVDPQRGGPRMAVVVPLLATPTAAVVLEVNPQAYLYPLIELWPTDSRSAETVLVRRDGDDVLFLNSLRHEPGKPLGVRIPLTRTNVPAVSVVQGREGVFSGLDYRGVPVVSVTRRVPGSTWCMVSKVDVSEAFAVWRVRSLLMLLLTIGGVLLAGATGMVTAQRMETARVRSLYEQQAARAVDELRYETTLRGIGDGVIVADHDGRARLLNPVAEALTGWTDSEARGKPVTQVFQIVHESTRAEVESPVERVLREGVVVNLANHTLLIARDGTERPIADSGAPVHGDDGQVDGVVLVFRDQTDERAAERAMCTALEQTRKRERHVAALAQASRAALDAKSVETASAAILTACCDVTGATSGVIALLSADGAEDRVLLLSVDGSVTNVAQDMSGPLRALHERIRDERRTTYTNDFPSSPWARLVPAGHMEVRNALVSPLVLEGESVGVIALANRPGDFDDDDAAVVGALAELASLVMQRSRAEQAVRASEATHRALIEGLPDIVERHDLQGRHLFVSPIVADLIGLTQEEVVGKSHRDLGLSEELAILWDGVIADVIETAAPRETSFELDTPNGRCVYNWRLIPEFDDAGQVSSVLTVMRDITAHRQAEATIHQMAEMLDSAPSAITVQDGEGRWLYSNSKNAELHGYTVDEFMALSVSDIEVTERDALADQRWQLLASKGEVVAEVEHRRRDGTTFPLEVDLKQVAWNGRPALLSVGTDITERRLIEETQLFLIECGLPSSGIDFFEHLAGYLSRALNACYVCIDQLVGDGLSARTVSVWHDGHFEDNVSYTLEDTPCGQVAQEGFCWFAQGVRHLFPNDKALMDMGAESYAGALLHGSDGRAIGLIAVIGREPSDQQSLAETILKLVSVRAAGELERRSAEQALRDSEELLAQTGDLAHVGGWSLDLATLGLTWTPGNYRIHEVDEDFEPTLANSVAFYAPASRRRLYRAVLRMRRDGQPFDLELDMVTARGNRRQVHVVGRARWRDGEVAEVVGALQDITSRKRTEEALRLRLELTSFGPGHSLDDLLRHTLDRVGAMLDSPIGFYHFVNDDQQSLTLQVWSTSTERDFCSAEGKGQHYAVSQAGVWADAIRTRQVTVHNDYAALPHRRGMPEGHAEVVRQLVVPILRDNRVVAVLGVGNKATDYTSDDVQAVAYLADVTWDLVERRRAELDRERLETQLIQAQKMEAVGRLAGGVAHDFNNMLGVILGHVELVMDQIPPNHAIHADLLEVQSAAERSADLTRQLLAFARRQAVEPKVLDLNAHVRGSLTMLRRLIGEDIELLFVPSEPLWSVRIDPAQVNQVIANLCVNGRDAISGVGAVTIETSNLTYGDDDDPSRDGLLSGDYVVLSVSDTGCGIDPDTLDSIFEPFYTTKDLGEGTGLGLAMVYGVAKQNGGHIDVQSEPGVGTTFRLLLPRWVSADAEVEPVAASPTAGHQSGSGTILLVEDEGAILRVSQRILTAAGYNVLVAGSPNEAIRLAHAHDGSVDLLITDVIMPEMSGRELAELLVALNPELAVVFMSGYTADVIARHGVLESGVHFLQKPFTRADLIAKVGDALEQREPA